MRLVILWDKVELVAGVGFRHHQLPMATWRVILAESSMKLVAAFELGLVELALWVDLLTTLLVAAFGLGPVEVF